MQIHRQPIDLLVEPMNCSDCFELIRLTVSRSLIRRLMLNLPKKKKIIAQLGIFTLDNQVQAKIKIRVVIFAIHFFLLLLLYNVIIMSLIFLSITKIVSRHTLRFYFFLWEGQFRHLFKIYIIRTKYGVRSVKRGVKKLFP